jgi:hypothetical protein
MITCDVFDLDASIDGRTLHWKISTDLPGGTRIIVSVFRLYTNTGGDQCVWILWDDAVLLTPTGSGDCNGASGTLNIDQGDKNALAQFNELLGPYSSGVTSPIGDELRVQATVGGRQPLKAFGKNNCNLSGAMVVEASPVNIVREEVVLEVEMRPEFQPIEVD